MRRAARLEPPLYEPALEHDACGVGFVADAGGRHASQVLPLALAGLAALGHRGAFAADGESSDGAGVSLPLDADLRYLLAPGPGGRPGVVMAFLPGAGRGTAAGRRIVEQTLGAAGLTLAGWRDVPVCADALGREARASAPAIRQAIVTPPSGMRADAFERELVLARRSMEAAARAAGLDDFAIASASSRVVVYKGLVAGDAISRFYGDLARPLRLSYAVFHQRYATNTTPRWQLAQPFRLVAHNGEINTVRGNRLQVEGRHGDLGRGTIARRLAQAGPLVSPTGSDSQSLDEALELLVLAGWPLDAALLALVPESLALRTLPHHGVHALQTRTAALLAPWDGPAALVFADGRRVGAVLDRNGLRPAAYAVTHDGLVALASEAGAVPIDASETRTRGRLGPGEMLLVDPRAGVVLTDADAKAAAIGGARRVLPSSRPVPTAFRDDPGAATAVHTSAEVRWTAGLDAERLRLDVKTMVMEGHEPLWSMGDDTPLPGLARQHRPAADYLRQCFAQVTNPAIDPERERIVMELGVELGRRPRLLGRLPENGRTVRLARPFIADLAGLVAAVEASAPGRRPVRLLDVTWDPHHGPAGLERGLERIVSRAITAARRGAVLLVLSDRRIARGRIAIPSVIAAGGIHAALVRAGLRGRTDILVDAADILDVHTAAMVLASGAGALHPRLAIELALEMAGTRGAESLGPADAVANLLTAFEAGLRKTLARMGVSTAASYVGSNAFDVLELTGELTERCFPGATLRHGTVDLDSIAERQLRRWRTAPSLAGSERLPDPGHARFRADGEAHLYAPSTVKAIQTLAHGGEAGAENDAGSTVALPRRETDRLELADGGAALTSFRLALARDPALVRDRLAVRRRRPVPLDEVEPARQIVRRFVSSAMSLGSLSPEAHQALTLGMRLAGGSSNTGEGGEDPAWYVAVDGRRHDSAIKQVASARFGVTAQYLARAEQLEIKIAQGSKPGEGGQLPGRKATPLIAALRRGQPGQAMISPPPHHDIYSIEDLAQLIADLRAINPEARIGVKLVASVGVGTIASGVAKAGADYVQISGHAGGTGASPLRSIKHVGIPWELGLAEAHQTLLRNGLRDRVSLRTDGGLQTGRDVLVAALLGAEEFGFGTAALVALGCDMARQCHLDTCPTGIATQREDLRAKFAGRPEDVARFFLALAEDVRRELAAVGARTLGEVVGLCGLLYDPAPGRGLDVAALLCGPSWPADTSRRADPASSRLAVKRQVASAAEERLVTELLERAPEDASFPGPLPIALGGGDPIPLRTADRAVGARVSGVQERTPSIGPVSWQFGGAAGQSFGAFAGPGVELTLTGQANDYVGKGLSGGVVTLAPEAALRPTADQHAIAGNTCLYGATGGRLHVVGRAGMRFAVRNSGAEAVVEGLGPHGCEYMTGGTVVVLGPVGGNFGAGMTGGRAFLYDPDGVAGAALDARSVRARRLDGLAGERADARAIVAELEVLVRDHAAAGSVKAARLLAVWSETVSSTWLVEPVEQPTQAAAGPESGGVVAAGRAGRQVHVAIPGRAQH